MQINPEDIEIFIDDIPIVDVILVAGPTGSGKTSIARQIAQRKNGIILSSDNYFVNVEEVPLEDSPLYGVIPQWDSPQACDWERLTNDVYALVRDLSVDMPLFDFSTNKRGGYKKISKKVGQPLVVEGLLVFELGHALNSQSISFHSIFVNADENVRVKRIRERDRRFRDRPDETFERRFYFIRTAESRWILKQTDNANALIDTTFWWPAPELDPNEADSNKDLAEDCYH